MRSGLMTDYTMRDDWICFNYTTTEGRELYVETKLKTTVEEDIEAAKEMTEVVHNGGG
jgi:hypothetical protein